jgi:hypothetical protein
MKLYSWNGGARTWSYRAGQFQAFGSEFLVGNQREQVADHVQAGVFLIFSVGDVPPRLLDSGDHERFIFDAEILGLAAIRDPSHLAPSAWWDCSRGLGSGGLAPRY